MQDPGFVPALSAGIIKDTHSCDRPAAGPCGVILGLGGWWGAVHSVVTVMNVLGVEGMF